MRLDQQHIFKSSYHNIKLIATEFDEPHPGHTLWRYEFYINDQLVQNKYLNYKWSGLHPNLDGFELEPEGGDFIYLPIEQAIIYDVKNDQYHQVESIGTRNSGFVKNRFSESRLLIVWQHALQVTSLATFTSQTILFPEKKYLLIDAYYIDDLLIMKYKDLRDYEIYTKKYDHGSMDFEK